MKILLSTVIVVSFFVGSCARKEKNQEIRGAEAQEASKIYQFDTLFYGKVSSKYIEDNNLGDSNTPGEPLPRLTPRGYLVTIGVDLSDSDYFRFEQDFIHLRAPSSTHDLLTKGYEDLMKKPLRELSESEYSQIISTREYYSNDPDSPFSSKK